MVFGMLVIVWHFLAFFDGVGIRDGVQRLGLGLKTRFLRSRDPFFEVSVSKVSVSKVSGLVSVSVSKDLGLELFVSRLCISYFFMKFCKKEFF